MYFTFLDDDFLTEEDPIGGFINPRILAVTDLLAVIRFQPSSGMSSVTVVSTRDRVEVFDYSCLADGFPAALVSKDVLLLVKWAAGDDEVLAWNIHTKAEIFKKKLMARPRYFVFDRHHQQVMVGRNQAGDHRDLRHRD